MKGERIVCAALAVTAAALAVFGVNRQLRLGDALRELDGAGEENRRLSAELRDSGEAYQAELSDVKAQLERVSTELEGVRAELDTTRSALEDAESKVEELSSAPRFDPDGPEYQQLYPDFYAPQPLDASKAPSGVIYLTFDDGPSARTDDILATLDREGIKATFFIVGRSGEANRERLRAIASAGHTLAMHSYSHDYSQIYASVEDFLADMYKVFTLIRDETGVKPTYFRFPGGSTNAKAYGIIEDITAEMLRRGFVPCDWNMSAQDATKDPLPVQEIINNVLRSGNVARGVVLMHDSPARTTTVQALPELISILRERGYTFAPLTPDVKPTVFNYRTPELAG